MPSLGGGLFSPKAFIPEGATILQIDRDEDFVYQTTTAQIPFDDTPPLVSEGALALAVNGFVPIKATSRILILGMLSLSSSNGGSIAAALFRDSVCLRTSWEAGDTNGFGYTIPMIVDELAASTASRNYQIRYGGNTGGNRYMNGVPLGRRYGGTSGCVMYVIEYDTP